MVKRSERKEGGERKGKGRKWQRRNKPGGKRETVTVVCVHISQIQSACKARSDQETTVCNGVRLVRNYSSELVYTRGGFHQPLLLFLNRFFLICRMYLQIHSPF